MTETGNQVKIAVSNVGYFQRQKVDTVSVTTDTWRSPSIVVCTGSNVYTGKNIWNLTLYLLCTSHSSFTWNIVAVV